MDMNTIKSVATAAVAPFPSIAPVMEIGTSASYRVVPDSNRDRTSTQAAHYKLKLPDCVVKTFDVKDTPVFMIAAGSLSKPEARVVKGEVTGTGCPDARLRKL